MSAAIHYEVFIRKSVTASWTLMMATENRAQAVETAEDALADKRAVAVRVTKETLDSETMAFNSVTILTRGAPEVKKKRLVSDEDAGPRCAGVADLYAPHARELIGRVLEDWLSRSGVTAFELLHRPDLAEQLEASGVELQHAIQKVAVPESQATGQAVHELVRHYQKLADQGLERLIRAGRANVFPSLDDRSLADIAHRLTGASDRAFAIGGVVARALTDRRGSRARVERLMELAEGAPVEGPPRALVMVAIEQILVELLAARTNLSGVLGPNLDQGAALAGVVRMIAPREIEALIRLDPLFAEHMPTVDGPAARLGARLEAGDFPVLAASLARMVLRELTSPRRLRPSDAQGEIDILRALAMSLTATAGRLLTLEEVQNAFSERSKSLITADFVAAYVRNCSTVLCEAESLTRLCENVTGTANKRSAARWLAACVTSLRFESEMRASGQTAAQKLAVLAALQREVCNAGLGENDQTTISVAIGAVGGVIEAEARLTASLGRAAAPVPQKLAALLRLAAGETAPLGPATERARAEAVRLFRAPDARAALGAAPETLLPLKALMKAAGLAA